MIHIKNMPSNTVERVPPCGTQRILSSRGGFAALLGALRPVVMVLLAATGLMGSAATYAGDLPNPAMTPGVLNPDIRQDNIATTVCVKGFTKTIRPPAYYTNKLKKTQIREYGYRDTNPKDYEEDHLIPLSVGGNPTDPRNLWPQPRNSEWGAEKKDQLEFAMFKAVCHHEVSLNDAQIAFAVNWIEAYKKYDYFLKKYSHGSVD